MPAPVVTQEPPKPESLERMLARARSQLAAGDYEAVLAEVERAARRGTPSGAWRMLEGDALRALARPTDAAGAYDRAAALLAGAERSEAAYSAAYLRFQSRDHERALTSLLDADATGSPLEERGLALRAQILEALGRKDDARAIAKRYLDRFPAGGLRSYMKALVER
jgi:hypothetical protein